MFSDFLDLAVRVEPVEGAYSAWVMDTLAGNALQTQSMALSYALNLSIFDSCSEGSSLLDAI